jgi:hypothetical protein
MLATAQFELYGVPNPPRGECLPMGLPFLLLFSEIGHINHLFSRS